MTSPVPKTMAAPTRVSGSNPRRDRTHSTLRPSRPLWLHGLLGFPVLWERLGLSPPSLPHHLTDLKVCVLRPRPHGRPPRRRLGPGPAPASSAPVSSPRPPARRAGSSSSLGSGRPSPLSSEVPHGPFTPERPRARALAAFPSLPFHPHCPAGQVRGLKQDHTPTTPSSWPQARLGRTSGFVQPTASSRTTGFHSPSFKLQTQAAECPVHVSTRTSQTSNSTCQN